MTSRAKPLPLRRSTALPPTGSSTPFALKTGAIEPSATNHLVISVGHAGTLWLQLVSLFPPTYHNRVNGNRIDLMDKLAAMHPAFLRFPGATTLKAITSTSASSGRRPSARWSTGPRIRSPWSYHSSDGMGLLEFLEWCEDLQMQPVLAVYAGYSLAQEHVNPGADLEPYVQDALDELEYVTGGPRRSGAPSARKTDTPLPSSSPTSKSATKTSSTNQAATTAATRSSIRPSRQSILTCN